ncbi:MAG TPA: type II secretion system F family protein [Candidatus Omnitrophota bacterium]|nr:type II secretion system F family protein [Candidatus Omnitrophota bacterium]HRZ14474.1 type II secretion system F family protein [Candidatus Omnitrophota bacterium]
MLYRFKAKKGPGSIVESELEALSEREAIDRISAMGYVPIHIELAEQPGQAASGSVQAAKTTLVRVGSRDLTLFTRQLASLLKSGVPILRALSIIAEQTGSLQLRSILYTVHRAVKEGAPFSSVLARYPGVFSSLYIAMIRTGEDSGALPEVLFRIAEYRTKQEEAIRRFRMGMVYPLLMVLVGIGTVVFMLTYVMPRLMGVYTTLGRQLPLPTQILIGISAFLRQWGGWIVGVLIVGAALAKQQSQTKPGKTAMSAFILHLPVFGALVQKAELARFSRTLELLLHSGLPILKAITITIPVLENEIIKSQLTSSYKSLEQGGSFSASLKNSRVIPPFMSNLINVGEESGKIDDSLKEVADAYERDTDEALQMLNSLLEPVMIIGMGVIVGFIVMAMLLPIFEMNLMVQ